MKTTPLFLFFSFCVALVAMALSAPPAEAYETYSAGKIGGQSYGNCNTCHNNFRDDDYISPADGKAWFEFYTEADETEPDEEPGLHDVHRHIMMDEDSPVSKCDVCHWDSRYPVYLNFSASEYFDPIGCIGCHGRPGEGAAGLRQHHTLARVKECMICHADANPENFTPAGEDVKPVYYTYPNDVFVNKPTDPCNQRGAENYAGGPKGLDNDGDHRYDMSDPDCTPVGPQ
jgi:hypothetical protein